jgi:hypothetical protein
MAWRLHENVIRGEVDNRERGFVRGKIWLHGHTEPVVLELNGNAAPDLAGSLLTFENAGEIVPMPPDAQLAVVQRGTIGDLTASRKVRVFDIPVAEAYDRLKKKLPVPEHMANCLYLEWFSEANGRVVIESADYKLTISPPAWRLSPEEEEQRRRDVAKGFSGFVKILSDAVAAEEHKAPPDKQWDEFDYEKFLRETDARTEKYAELLDKYMDHPDRDRIIAREMGWTELEEELAGSNDCEADDPPEELDPFEMERPCDFPPPEPQPATHGIDWVRVEDGAIAHPLSLRVFNSSMVLWEKCNELGPGKMDDADLYALLTEYQVTSAKLAGALDRLGYAPPLEESPFLVACLKRALNHLHAAQAALEKVAPKPLLPAEIVESTRAELFSIREEILRLMKQYRGAR